MNASSNYIESYIQSALFFYSLHYLLFFFFFFFFFFNDTATTEIYTLSLHDALPISLPKTGRRFPGPVAHGPSPDLFRGRLVDALRDADRLRLQPVSVRAFRGRRARLREGDVPARTAHRYGRAACPAHPAGDEGQLHPRPDLVHGWRSLRHDPCLSGRPFSTTRSPAPNCRCGPRSWASSGSTRS